MTHIPPDAYTVGGDKSGTDIQHRGAVFGTSSTWSAPTAVLQIREVLGTLRLTRTTLSAHSPEAITSLEFCAKRAFPRSIKSDQHARFTLPDSSKMVTSLVDMDGNILDVVCGPPSPDPREPKDRVARILKWEYAVAHLTPQPASMLTRHTASNPPGTKQQDSELAYGSFTDVDPRKSSIGTMAGLLTVAAAGVAMGAAITYNAMKRETTSAPSQASGLASKEKRAPGFDASPPSDYQTRAMVSPDPVINNGPLVLASNAHPYTYNAQRRPATGGIGTQSRVPSQYGSEIEGPSAQSFIGVHPSRSPSLIADPAQINQVSSVQSPRPQGLASHRSMRDGDGRSFVSVRSQRSSSTIKPLRRNTSTESATSRNRPSMPVDDYKTVAGSVPYSGRTSVITAHRVPLPRSNVGSSHACWDEQESIAPSDSISCVGSRRS